MVESRCRLGGGLSQVIADTTAVMTPVDAHLARLAEDGRAALLSKHCASDAHSLTSMNTQ